MNRSKSVVARSTAGLTVVAFVSSLGSGLLIATPAAFAQNTGTTTTNESACANQTNDSDALEQCNKMKIDIIAASFMAGEMIIYTIAAGVCVSACGDQKISQGLIKKLDSSLKNLQTQQKALLQSANSMQTACTTMNTDQGTLATDAANYNKVRVEMGKDMPVCMAVQTACTNQCGESIGTGCACNTVTGACAKYEAGEPTSVLAVQGFTQAVLGPDPTAVTPVNTKTQSDCAKMTADAQASTPLVLAAADAVQGVDQTIFETASAAFIALDTAATNLTTPGSPGTGDTMTGDGSLLDTTDAPAWTKAAAAVSTAETTCGTDAATQVPFMTAATVPTGISCATCGTSASDYTAANTKGVTDLGAGVATGIIPDAAKFTGTATAFYGVTQDYGAATKLFFQSMTDTQNAYIKRMASAALCKKWETASLVTDLSGAGATIALAMAVTKDVGATASKAPEILTPAAMDLITDLLLTSEPKDPNDIACPKSFLTMLMQELARGADIGYTIYDATQQANYAASQAVGNFGSAPPPGAGLAAPGSAGVSAGNAASTNSQQGNAFKSDGLPVLLKGLPPNAAVAFNPAKSMQQNATAAELAEPTLNKIAPGVTTQGLANAIANGQNPMSALAAGMVSTSPDAATALAGFAASKDAILADGEVKDMLSKTPHQSPTQVAQDFANAGSHSSGSSGPAMPDMSSLLASLTKKPPAPSAAAPVEAPAARAPASVSSDGLHPPDVSLFDIIGSRYQTIAAKFLAGEDLPSDVIPQAGTSVAPSSSLVPKNIYLKH